MDSLIFLVSLLVIPVVLIWSIKENRFYIANMLMVGELFLAGFREINLFGFTAAGLVALGLIGFNSVVILFKNNFRLYFSRVDMNAIAFILVFILTVLAAVPAGAISYGLGPAFKSSYWILWASPLLVLFSKKLDEKKYIKTIVAVIIICGIGQSILGIIRYSFGIGTIFLTTGGDRYVPSSMSVVIAGAFIYLLFDLQISFKIFKGALLVICLIGIILSFNRQIWVALLAVLSIYPFLMPRVKRGPVIRGMFVALIGLFALGIISALIVDFEQVAAYGYLISRVGGGNLANLILDPSVQFRFAAWESAINGIEKSPILGMGWGSPFSFTFVVPKNEIIQTFDNSSPHNTYLWLAFNAGLPALGAYLAMNIKIVISNIRAFRKGLISDSRFATTLVLIVFLIGSIWWDYHTVMYLSVPYWVIVSILILKDDRVKI